VVIATDCDLDRGLAEQFWNNEHGAVAKVETLHG
jgi:predicted nuclease with TOPRIM domain